MNDSNHGEANKREEIVVNCRDVTFALTSSKSYGKIASKTGTCREQLKPKLFIFG